MLRHTLVSSRIYFFVMFIQLLQACQFLLISPRGERMTQLHVCQITVDVLGTATNSRCRMFTPTELTSLNWVHMEDCN